MFIHMYWITESPVVKGKVKVDAGTGIVRLGHPGHNSKAVLKKQNFIITQPNNVF